MNKPKDAPQKRNKLEQVTYLAALTAIVSYLDDTGEEHHQKRVTLAEEWNKAFAELNATIEDEDKSEEKEDAR